MQAIDCKFKLLTKLNLINKDIVCFPRIIMALNIVIKSMILLENLIFQIKKIDKNDEFL